MISNNWKIIDFPAGIKDSEKFERNSKDIALNILCAPTKEKINIICKSKCNRKRKYQVVLLMITDNKQEDTEDKWHYIALKSELTDDGYKKPTQSLSRLSRGITSIIMEIFIVWVVYIHFELLMHLKNLKDYAKPMIIAI